MTVAQKKSKLRQLHLGANKPSRQNQSGDWIRGCEKVDRLLHGRSTEWTGLDRPGRRAPVNPPAWRHRLPPPCHQPNGVDSVIIGCIVHTSRLVSNRTDSWGQIYSVEASPRETRLILFLRRCGPYSTGVGIRRISPGAIMVWTETWWVAPTHVVGSMEHSVMPRKPTKSLRSTEYFSIPWLSPCTMMSS
ncbi:hypothetical protein BJX96DRAFT_22228 [Aspergillus floccosus]